MKAIDVIERFCKLQAEVSEVLGYHLAADCFCGRGGGFGANHVHSEHYRNDGESLKFIEEATRAALAQRRASTSKSEHTHE